MTDKPQKSQDTDPTPGSYEGARLANLRAFASMTDDQKVEWLGWAFELLHPFLPSRDHCDPDDWSKLDGNSGLSGTQPVNSPKEI